MKKILLPIIFLLSLIFVGLGYEITRINSVIPELQLNQTSTNISEQGRIALGADGVQLFGGQVYYLNGGGISSSATSLDLTSLTIPMNGYEIQDSELSNTFYITIEPGNRTRQEFVSCTTVAQSASTNLATLSGCVRGLSPLTPYTASTSLQFTHDGGSKVIFSNPPQVYEQAAFKSNEESISGLWTFNTILPTSSILATSSTQFVTKSYVDGGLLAGAATSTETVTGIVRLATALQQASSTPTTSNTPYVNQAQYATDTPQRGCAVGYESTAGASCGVIATLTGKIRNVWLSVFGDNNTWTGANTFNTATTTFNATTSFSGINYGVGEFADFNASTTITGSTLPQPVFLATSTNTLYLSDANVATSTDFLGFAVRNGVSTTTYKVATQLSGVVKGFTGLTPGAQYYVQDTEGTIGTTIGTNEISVGQAISATEIYLSRNPNGVWQYVGSATCATGSGSCDTTSNLLARFAIVDNVIAGSTGCSGPTAMATTQFRQIVTKIGATSATHISSPSCADTRNPDGNISATALFTSTSAIRMTLGGTETLSSQTQTAYFYR